MQEFKHITEEATQTIYRADNLASMFALLATRMSEGGEETRSELVQEKLLEEINHICKRAKQEIPPKALGSSNFQLPTEVTRAEAAGHLLRISEEYRQWCTNMLSREKVLSHITEVFHIIFALCNLSSNLASDSTDNEPLSFEDLEEAKEVLRQAEDIVTGTHKAKYLQSFVDDPFALQPGFSRMMIRSQLAGAAGCLTQYWHYLHVRYASAQ